MRPNEVDIEAESEQQAVSEAEVRLGVLSDNIKIEKKGNVWHASRINGDADIDIEVSGDKMEALVIDAVPPVGEGHPILYQEIEAKLLNMGVTVELEKNEIKKIVDRVNSGDDVRGMVLARGIESEPAVDAMLKPVGELAAPVFPGDVFVTKSPCQDAKAGSNVLGEIVPAVGKPKGRDIIISSKGGCAIADDGMSVTSEVYGMVHIVSNRIHVEPLLTVSPDKMQLFAKLYPYTFKGDVVTIEHVMRAVDAFGVKVDIMKSAVDEALEFAVTTGSPQDEVLIARGSEPVDGEDGKVEFSIETAGSKGTERDDGSVDYYERGRLRSVTQGEVLGKIILPTKGVPGTDVFGSTVAADNGEPVSVTSGDNVEFRDETGEFVSTIDGMVFYARNVLSVTDTYEINGDVDFETGNVRTDTGSVSIKGTVKNGFVVESPCNVLVGEAIENAHVYAAGDVEVHRGILMDQDGKIEAGGSVFAHFAQNAHIEVEGDVVIDNDITNCHITAGGSVIAIKGKGRLQGGVIRAGIGMDVNEIGSEMGIATQVVIGLEPQDHKGLFEEKKVHEATIKKIDSVIGRGDAKQILLRTPKAKRVAVAKLMKAQIVARQRIEEIEEKIQADMLALRKRMSKARIKVKKVIHPGTVVKIAGCVMEVEQPISSSQLYYDPARDKIRWAPY